MKKLLLALILLTTLSHQAMASCDGGEEITGNYNKHVYCISNKGMNWWSAFTWCTANGRHLATQAEACNNRSWGDGYCPNLSLGRGIEVWTAQAIDDNKAYIFSFVNGYVMKRERSGATYRALCY